MVVDVKEGKLVPLFAQDNEDGVPEIPDLRNVEQPQKVSNGRVFLVVSDARCDGVAAAVGQENSFNGHVGAQHDLRNIVKELDRVRVQSFSVLHDLGSKEDEQKVDKGDSECRCEICHPESLKNNTDATIIIEIKRKGL